MKQCKGLSGNQIEPTYFLSILFTATYQCKSTSWCNANPMVVKEILSRMDRSSVNYRMRSQSIKWKVLRACAKWMVRGGLLKSMLAHRLAHGAGLTALHYAARRGDVEIVTLLLEAGADPYLENEMGLNSFDITEKFGPFPSVMRVLNKSKNN